MADFDLDLSAHDHQPASPKAADQDVAPAPMQLKAARKVARKSVALNALADSLAGGGVAAGNDMAVARKTASDVADEGFAGAAHEVPYRAEMESSFGADFSGVNAYSDGPARKASTDLGAEAYAAGDQVAFNSANPDKATVAHELTHVLQHTGGAGVQRKSNDGDGGIETSGEAQADMVEAAVKSCSAPARRRAARVRPARVARRSRAAPTSAWACPSAPRAWRSPTRTSCGSSTRRSRSRSPRSPA